MARFDTIVGKYIYLKIQGIEYRVYFEENGKGIPMLCQHTAGKSCQEWSHLLNDKEITAKYRVIAADLPYHGKSNPPESVEWWKQEYKLTKSFFMDFHMALSHALGLEKPVYIGSSIGGFLAPDLALEHPDEFRAVIGVEAASKAGLYTRNISDHPQVGTESVMARVMQLTGPASPEKYIHQVSWVASQCASFIASGDLYYYFDHDLTVTARQIDTSRVAVYFLTGEYDPSSSPDDTRKLAEQIKGAKFTEMKGLSHQAISENPEMFKKYLMPILNEIAMQGKKK